MIAGLRPTDLEDDKLLTGRRNIFEDGGAAPLCGLHSRNGPANKASGASKATERIRAG